MNEQTALLLTDITQSLAEPFPIEDIELLPKGTIERDGKTLCMALPYADVRVYEDRLNKLAPGEWSTPPPIALVVGTKLVVYVTVTIHGISHTDVGEASPGDNQATESWAQSFKRACSQFGLGRYLYNLDKAWVPYNPQSKRIDLDAAGIGQIVRGMYLKAGIPPNGHSAPPQSQNDGVALLNSIAQAKKRAASLSLATDTQTWLSFLQEATGEEGLQEKDLTAALLGRINGHLTQVEKRRQQGRKAS